MSDSVAEGKRMNYFRKLLLYQYLRMNGLMDSKGLFEVTIDVEYDDDNLDYHHERLTYLVSDPTVKKFDPESIRALLLDHTEISSERPPKWNYKPKVSGEDLGHLSLDLDCDPFCNDYAGQPIEELSDWEDYRQGLIINYLNRKPEFLVEGSPTEVSFGVDYTYPGQTFFKHEILKFLVELSPERRMYPSGREIKVIKYKLLDSTELKSQRPHDWGYEIMFYDVDQK